MLIEETVARFEFFQSSAVITRFSGQCIMTATKTAIGRGSLRFRTRRNLTAGEYGERTRRSSSNCWKVLPARLREKEDGRIFYRPDGRFTLIFINERKQVFPKCSDTPVSSSFAEIRKATDGDAAGPSICLPPVLTVQP